MERETQQNRALGAVRLDRSIFRAYDIRGVAGRDFDETSVALLGRAMGRYFRRMGGLRAVLGRDCRATSPGYAEALAAGLTAEGIDVTLLGMVPTPLFYFAVQHLGFPAGVIVTASHNPPEYNGFKVWCGETTIGGEALAEIWRIQAEEDCSRPHPRRGIVGTYDATPAYLERMAADFHAPQQGAQPLKVVLDAGNGAGGPLAAALLSRLPVELRPICCEPDGTFPNHHPDPVVAKNMELLAETVRRTGADVGLGLDGDADRLGVYDETGAPLPGDRLLALLAREILTTSPGAAIIGEAKCSHLLYKDIAAHGGRGIMGVTGHSPMKQAVQRHRAALAGEMSGHLFFADRYTGVDDGIYAALRIIELLLKLRAAKDTFKLSTALSDWPKTYYTPEIRQDCPETVKFRVVREMESYLGQHFGGGRLTTVDGVRLNLDDGWALVRASNTQPALVLRFEAQTEERLAELRAQIEGKLTELLGAATS